MIGSRTVRICTILVFLNTLCVASHAASMPETDEDARPFGIFVEDNKFDPLDPWHGSELAGFRIETPFGILQSFPSRHSVDQLTADGNRTLLSRRVQVDGLPLSRPTGLAWDGDNLWVADTGNRRILKAKFRGEEIDADSLAAVYHEEFRRPIGLAFDPQSSELYASDSWSDRIFVIQDEAIQREFSMHGSRPGFLSGPLGIAYDSGLLYVADSRNSRIQVFQTEDGSPHSEWGLHVIRPHESDGHLHYPTDMRFSDDGSLIVVDEPWEMRQQVFRRASDEESVPERLPIGADDFVHYGAGVDSYDRLLAITDPDTHTIRIFDLTLDTPVLIGVIGRYGTAPHEFIHPSSVAFLPPSDDAPLRLVAADRGNAKLALYTIDWSSDEPLRFRPNLAKLHRTVEFERLLGEKSVEPLISQIDPVSLCVEHDGSIAVLDDANGAVVRFDSRLRPIESQQLPHAPPGHPTVWKSVRPLPQAGLICINSAQQQLVMIPPRHSSAQPRLKQIDLSEWATEPTDILVTQSRSWVVDRARHRLIETDADLMPVALIGSSGLNAGEFHHPVSISRIDGNRILVVDRGNHRIQLFSDDWLLDSISGPRLYISDADISGQPVRTVLPSQK